MSRAARPSSLSLLSLTYALPTRWDPPSQISPLRFPMLDPLASLDSVAISVAVQSGVYLMQSIYLGHLVGREMGDRVPGADPCPSGEAGGLLLP